MKKNKNNESNKKRRLLAVAGATSLAVALAALTALAGCASSPPPPGPAPTPTANTPDLPPPQTVTSRCLARVATPGFAPPTESTLSGTQWERYVSCRLASNMVVATTSVSGNPEAVVSMTLTASGAADTVRLSRSSGDAAWDAAVERAIGAAGPFPPAPFTLHVGRVEMRFRPGPPQPGVEAIGGTNAGVGLQGGSHWSVHHCTTISGATACN
ncbi:energy transducer TonB [Paraburkholderia ferrariae]|uniref:energy transducer TonB n=1 Tax=Paraburkholderia ferrariae TaxID=386056 RepID=UPI0004826CC9|nr:energy transducer TonB [Paraburkholderia ferrariae]